MWHEGRQASGNSVFIDEFSAAGTKAGPVTSVAIPDNGTAALIMDGTALSEGGLTRSEDGTALCFAGYNSGLKSRAADAAGSLAETAATAIPRNLATLDAFGAYQQLQTNQLL